MSRISRLANKLALTSSLAGTACLILSPMSSYALGSTNTAKTSPFCTELPVRATTITGRVSTLVGKVSQAWAQQDQKLTAEYQKVDQDVTVDRQKADSERTGDFNKLEAKAKTDAEKQAVQTYEAAVQNAVSTRRAAYDTARQTYRAGVQAAITTRRGTVTGQLNTFQSSVNSAISIAEASCASTPNDGLAIRQTLQASLKSARETFQGDRKGDETVGSQVKQLATTRNSAFKAADQAFQASLSAARTTLKQAFGKTSV